MVVETNYTMLDMDLMVRTGVEIELNVDKTLIDSASEKRMGRPEKGSTR